ncbi:MAG: hypothetical protein WAL98_16100 [Desulfatiglandaceae bacterium]|jgi:hypothetical protein
MAGNPFLRRNRISLLLIAVMVMWTSVQSAHAKVDLTSMEDIKLDVGPLDVATSTDGKLVFLLAPGKLLVYSVPEKKVTKSLVVDADFDRVTYSEGSKLLILTGSTSKRLRIVRVEPIQEIDISGHPFKGPSDAPVTVAVFDDYQ